MKQTEHDIQATLIRWVDLMAQRHPEMRLLYAIPNGGFRHPATAAKLKAEGVRPGVPDLCLPVPRDKWHGLYIEMKTPSGTVRQQQREWLNALADNGYQVVVCHGWISAAKEIFEYLGINQPFDGQQP